MDVAKVLHMNKGAGETSYAQNSTVQKQILFITNPYAKEALVDYLSTNFHPSEEMSIADLGCSSGTNALMAISKIIDAVYDEFRKLGRPSPELMVFLNDLPEKDFNTVFTSLPNFCNKLKEEKGGEFGPCFIAGVPGSFHGRLFPSNSLHLVHSSFSLHWLSQPPPGLDARARSIRKKRKLYISKTSPKYVVDSYRLQFKEDFHLFLKSRAKEVILGGRIVLSFMGRSSLDPAAEEGCYHWELLPRSLMNVVAEGIIEEETVDCFNVPCYAPCPQELRQVIQDEGSFVIHGLHAMEIDWDGGEDATHASSSRGERVAKTHRVVVESMLALHFGSEKMDELFRRYGNIVDDHLAVKDAEYINLVLSVICSDKNLHL